MAKQPKLLLGEPSAGDDGDTADTEPMTTAASDQLELWPPLPSPHSGARIRGGSRRGIVGGEVASPRLASLHLDLEKSCPLLMLEDPLTAAHKSSDRPELSRLERELDEWRELEARLRRNMSPSASGEITDQKVRRRSWDLQEARRNEAELRLKQSSGESKPPSEAHSHSDLTALWRNAMSAPLTRGFDDFAVGCDRAIARAVMTLPTRAAMLYRMHASAARRLAQARTGMIGYDGRGGTGIASTSEAREATLNAWPKTVRTSLTWGLEAAAAKCDRAMGMDFSRQQALSDAMDCFELTTDCMYGCS
uniref:Uncharacterized protein n=1 Tax=Odontella aurita TaxID=265563 RepID=A0A7S4I6Z0_9STRA|mmetsp:Transcript_20796/g.60519  ORF Transcript_20796/g.60519 Transcript_20796/m.60519 type:complete len:307 (+) Transcript_20796:136-1056(+)